MTEERNRRRLTAILAIDVVGFSRLMGADEDATHNALAQMRDEVLVPAAERHDGRLVNMVGDAALMEFPSVLGAVTAAVGIQDTMAGRAAEMPEDRRVLLRMGINLGDVIDTGDDMLGEGINVAFRLQALAEPGGIAVTREVRDQARDRLSYGFETGGEVTVKNIARPVEIFHLRGDGPAAAPPARRRLPIWHYGAALLAVAAVGSLVVFFWPTDTAVKTGPTLASAGGPPAIAVLPFRNMSSDPEGNYLGEGVAEDIITALSTSPGLRVISRTSSFAVAEPRPVQEIGKPFRTLLMARDTRHS